MMKDFRKPFSFLKAAFHPILLGLKAKLPKTLVPFTKLMVRKKRTLQGGKENENKKENQNQNQNLSHYATLPKTLQGGKEIESEKETRNSSHCATLPRKLQGGEEIESEKENQNLSHYATLPDNIVADEILTRLPARSLLRFKSVSKYWYSTICNPRFIRLHHNRAHNRLDGGCLAISANNNFFTSSYQGGHASCLLSSDHYDASISTHGLVLVYPEGMFKVSQPVFIFNPTTKELVSLPPIGNCIDFPNGLNTYANYSLGYDPLTGLYKVLAMCRWSQMNPLSQTNGIIQLNFDVDYYLFIFVLGANSWTWRKFDLAIPYADRFFSACCVNGAVYWLAHNSNAPYDFILAFDVGTEKFRKLPLYGKLGRFNMLSGAGDHVALSRDEVDYKGVPEVWVLENFDKGEWKKIKIKIEIPLHMCWFNDVRVIYCGEKLLLSPGFKEISEPLWVYYYDKSGKEWSMVAITGFPVDIDSLHRTVAVDVSNNVETLFSPRAGIESSNVFEFHSVESECLEFGLNLH